jgi:hypothetical protein
MNITKGKVERAQKVVLYGVEKIGKSTLASQFPNPLFLDTERGTELLNVDRASVDTATELYHSILALSKDSQGYKTVIIDSLDFTEDMLSAKICEENKWDSIESPGFGKGKVMLREEFEKLLFKLDSLLRKGLNVVLIGHAKIVPFTPPDTVETYHRFELKLDKENAVKVKSWADAILFANYKTTVVEGKDGKNHGIGGKDRVLYTGRTAAYDAGNRHGLADKLKFDVSELVPIFGKTAAPEGMIVGASISTKTGNVTSTQIAETVTGTAKLAPFELARILLDGHGIQHETLKSFLVSRKKLSPGESIAGLDPVYAQDAIDRISGFVLAVTSWEAAQK